MRPLLSVIIPARNEAQALPLLLQDLSALRMAGAEIILVDGASEDATREVGAASVDQLLSSKPGRALQMNTGAAAAHGEYLWFVHADTRIDAQSIQRLLDTLLEQPLWGRFDVRLSGQGMMLRLISAMINLRSRVTAIATGDQGIFVARKIFESQGGYASIALMEDVELCSRLKLLARPWCLRPALQTSSRRWEQNGVLRTVVLMWRLRLAYYLGASPESLAREYRRGPPL
ncbi:TIGR04283 family arsenosugar biosynthesis glycosyltransferase [Pseudomonas sp. NPDC078700]|uniref:TIGR04283 family arsenosugar biosynthesis glycosyltransferase n=1 Tax=Pseudomonas sp. NPDC078700 TaxID=3364424 RepID=UPI0037C92FFB